MQPYNAHTIFSCFRLLCTSFLFVVSENRAPNGKIKKHVSYIVLYTHTVRQRAMPSVESDRLRATFVYGLYVYSLLKIGKPHKPAVRRIGLSHIHVSSFFVETIAHSSTRISPISNAYIFMHCLMFALYVV